MKKTEHPDVYDVIDKEITHIEELEGKKQNTLPEEILKLDYQLMLIKGSSVVDGNTEETLHRIRKMAAICVRTMENHGIIGPPSKPVWRKPPPRSHLEPQEPDPITGRVT